MDPDTTTNDLPTYAPETRKNSGVWTRIALALGTLILCMIALMGLLIYGFLVPDTVRGGAPWGFGADTPPKDWEMTFDGDFAPENAHQWQLPQFKRHEDWVTTQLVDGTYRWDVTAKSNGFFAWDKALNESYADDMYVVAEMEQTNPDVTGVYYGITFQSTEPESTFVFVVYDLGQFDILWVNKGEQESLLDGTQEFRGINKTGVNKLAVLSRDDQLRFYINDQQVEHLSNRQYHRGKSGVCVGIYLAVRDAAVVVRSFKVYAPKP